LHAGERAGDVRLFVEGDDDDGQVHGKEIEGGIVSQGLGFQVLGLRPGG
jgi:hypothetical protein